MSVMRTDGINGTKTIYNVGVPTPKGVMRRARTTPTLGAPTGRSGAESASVPGAIYRNVWIGNHPRRNITGSALQSACAADSPDQARAPWLRHADPGLNALGEALIDRHR